MAKPEARKVLSEGERKAVFLALVAAQDAGMGVVQSREEVAERFGISDREVRRVEQEAGLPDRSVVDTSDPMLTSHGKVGRFLDVLGETRRCRSYPPLSLNGRPLQAAPAAMPAHAPFLTLSEG